MLWLGSSHFGTYSGFQFILFSLPLNFLVPHFLFQNVMYYLSFNYVTFRDFLILQFYQLNSFYEHLFCSNVSCSVYFISFIIINPISLDFTSIFLSKHRFSLFVTFVTLPSIYSIPIYFLNSKLYISYAFCDICDHVSHHGSWCRAD